MSDVDPSDVGLKDEVYLEQDGHCQYACIELLDGAIVRERIPLHVFKMQPDQQLFHFQSVARRLKLKANRHKVSTEYRNALKELKNEADHQPDCGDEQVPGDGGGSAAG